MSTKIDVIDTSGFLGPQQISAGVTEKYRALFSGLLDRGVYIAAAAMTVTSPASTCSQPVLSGAGGQIYVWAIYGGVNTTLVDSREVGNQTNSYADQTMTTKRGGVILCVAQSANGSFTWNDGSPAMSLDVNTNTTMGAGSVSRARHSNTDPGPNLDGSQTTGAIAAFGTVNYALYISLQPTG